MIFLYSKSTLWSEVTFGLVCMIRLRYHTLDPSKEKSNYKLKENVQP